jgi:hypothetical protein
LGVSYEATLTLEAAEITRRGTEILEFSPAGLSAYLNQEWREREARVTLSHNEAAGIDLTLSEAGELARTLAGLAVTNSAQGDQCPSWCTSGPHADPSIGDRNHTGDYTDVTLTLRHGAATMLLAAAQPPKVISETLGHSTVAFTMDV